MAEAKRALEDVIYDLNEFEGLSDKGTTAAENADDWLRSEDPDKLTVEDINAKYRELKKVYERECI